MRSDGVEPNGTKDKPAGELPRPTTRFRRRAWLVFQRALDPLAPPKPLRLPRN
jgi:hypothetical protein